MKHQSVRTLAIAALLLGLSGCCSVVRHGEEAGEEAGERAVSLSELPAPARATIERLVGSGEIRELDQEEIGGKTIYGVEARVDGKDVEYDVAGDGAVLSSEESVPFASLPEPAQSAAVKYFGSAAGLSASRELEEGKTFYEVVGRKDGRAAAVKLTEAGEIVEEENE